MRVFAEKMSNNRSTWYSLTSSIYMPIIMTCETWLEGRQTGGYQQHNKPKQSETVRMECTTNNVRGISCHMSYRFIFYNFVWCESSVLQICWRVSFLQVWELLESEGAINNTLHNGFPPSDTELGIAGMGIVGGRPSRVTINFTAVVRGRVMHMRVGRP